MDKKFRSNSNGFESRSEFKEDHMLNVEFYYEAVEHVFQSKEQGRPIFVEIPHIRIYTAGDKNVVIVNEVNEFYAQRFARQYKDFLENTKQTETGTPLDVWPLLSKGQVAELKAMNVRTVEQLAGMSDQLAMKIMGNHSIRQKALAWIDSSKTSAETNLRKEELAQRDEEIEKQARELALLKDEMAKLTAKLSGPKGKTKE